MSSTHGTARWILSAHERDMERAENEVLGKTTPGHYIPRWSSLAWQPFDADDDRPDDCDREIECNGEGDWPLFWKIAAALGNKATVRVVIDHPGVRVDVSNGLPPDVVIHERVVAEAIRARVTRAMLILSGMETPDAP